MLESESSLGTISWSELEQISLRNGMIAVIPDFQNFKVKLIAAGEGTKFSTEFNILEVLMDLYQSILIDHPF